MSENENDTNGKKDVDMEEFEKAASQSSVDITRIRLPSFWPTNPTTWFYQAEAQFEANRIRKDTSKFCLTISALTPEICDTVIDIISRPPGDNQYSELKRALISRHSISEEKRLEQLLQRTDIGDRKPSEIFRSMQQLAGTTFDESVVRNLWLRRLPQIIYISLIAVGDKPIEELTTLADKLFEASLNSNINSVTSHVKRTKFHQPSTSSSVSASSSDTVENRLARIESILTNLRPSGRTLSRSRRYISRSSSRDHPRNRSSSSSKSYNSRRCWYHRRFGSRAVKCIKPCNFNMTSKITLEDEKLK